MSSSIKPQRIRDPLHNLIEFGTDEFEHALWRIVQTHPFQRLRRIRQLGFSEFVYPGATHTRFSHSIGVFQTARHLMQIIERHIRVSGAQFKESQCRTALAASLVHDLGHGMFSHSFEEIGKEFGLRLAHHEDVSDLLIRDGEVGEILREMGSGFANDVAEVIKRGRPGNLYDAVVSSQFDADRLDYMQRDRLMTGVQNSGIDFTWLMANLEIGTVPTGVDQQLLGQIETFVLGPKATFAAETYVLALFQLYPTIYFHKATRAAERLFSHLMIRVIKLVRQGNGDKTGLSTAHPIVRFAQAPDSLDNAIALDDSVFWGALPMLAEATDPLIRECAERLGRRRFPKCIDIRQRLDAGLVANQPASGPEREEQKKRIERMVASIDEKLIGWSSERSNGFPRIITDRAIRDPYKRFQESKGPLNQILIRTASDEIVDVAEFSPVVAAIESFELFRAYVDGNDDEARVAIDGIVNAAIMEG